MKKIILGSDAWSMRQATRLICLLEHTVRPRDARFLGNEKVRAAQKRVT